MTPGLFPFALGIGVIAVAGAVAYLLAGVCNWRDYQEKVDWGVVWLYAGAMIFGRILDRTGAAYWLARTCIDLVAPLGMDSGLAPAHDLQRSDRHHHQPHGRRPGCRRRGVRLP